MDLHRAYVDYVETCQRVTGMKHHYLWNFARWLMDEIGEQPARKVFREAGCEFDVDPFEYGRVKA